MLRTACAIRGPRDLLLISAHTVEETQTAPAKCCYNTSLEASPLIAQRQLTYLIQLHATMHLKTELRGELHQGALPPQSQGCPTHHLAETLLPHSGLLSRDCPWQNPQCGWGCLNGTKSRPARLGLLLPCLLHSALFC